MKFNFGKNKTNHGSVPITSTSIVTTEFLRENGIEIRQLVNGSWAAVDLSRRELIGNDNSTWTSPHNIKKYCMQVDRVGALNIAINYMASNGVAMPSPKPTPDTSYYPVPTPTPLPQ